MVVNQCRLTFIIPCFKTLSHESAYYTFKSNRSRCRPLTIARSASMSDLAGNTKKTAPITPKCITTNKALLERLNNVQIALTGKQPTSSKPGDEAEITAWEVQLLARGGYNSVWLVSYKTRSQVGRRPVSSFTRLIVVLGLRRQRGRIYSTGHHSGAKSRSLAID